MEPINRSRRNAKLTRLFNAIRCTATVIIITLCVGIDCATAMTLREFEIECPIDGTRFKQMLAASGTQFGVMLDLKPYGAIAAPPPLPVCPQNGFVIYRRDFKPDEIEKLKRYVASPEYEAIKNETPYYRAAKIKGFMGEESERNAAFSLLVATWEAHNPLMYKQYALEALAAYQQILSKSPRDEERWLTQELLSGELERRLGRFDEAQRRFERLSQTEDLEPFHKKIIELQMRLISLKDSEGHIIPF